MVIRDKEQASVRNVLWEEENKKMIVAFSGLGLGCHGTRCHVRSGERERKSLCTDTELGRFGNK